MTKPFADWDETRAEVAPAVGPWHHPQVEEQGYGKPEMLVCATCETEWPCDYERDLNREGP